MSERKDEKWLDEQLQRAVNGSTPVFDAQAWKQKYAAEYDTLTTRRAVGWGLPHRFPTAKLALAAGVVVAAGILFFAQFRPTAEKPTPGPRPVAQESPAQMVSLTSLSAAFRSGGMEGLNKQCDRALETLGPRPTIVHVQRLFMDINSKG